MKDGKRNLLVWRKLDNSAKIFPLSASKKYSTVFRVSVLLKDEVNPEILKKAVMQALEKYKSFKVKMRKGFFWHYLEENNKQPVIQEENEHPCKYIDFNLNNGYLFKVTYFKNKINIDIFHALTDGNGGTIFFKEIVYTYLEMCYPEDLKNENRSIRRIEYDTEDAYLKNYDKKSKSVGNDKRAYKLKGKKIKGGAVSVIHQIINLEQLKEETKKYNATITQYLTAVLMYSIYNENYIKSSSKKPIKICIPVNLKKYFTSKTISNFFSYITILGEIEKKQLYIFDKTIEFVKEEFAAQLTEEEIIKTMSNNVKLGNSPFIKMIPLFLKIFFVKLAYIEIKKHFSITYSNLGRIGIIGNYQKYIDDFLILIAPERFESIKCSSCTFENKMVFTFTSILDDNRIEKCFYNFLKEKGIDIEIESNGVLDDISKQIKK